MKLEFEQYKMLFGVVVFRARAKNLFIYLVRPNNEEHFFTNYEEVSTFLYNLKIDELNKTSSK